MVLVLGHKKHPNWPFWNIGTYPWDFCPKLMTIIAKFKCLYSWDCGFEIKERKVISDTSLANRRSRCLQSISFTPFLSFLPSLKWALEWALKIWNALLAKSNWVELNGECKFISNPLFSIQIFQTFSMFRLSGILGHLGQTSRMKRSSDAQDIAMILPNNEVCLAGHKLIFRVPTELEEAEKFREALNTFIMMMSHLHGGNSGYYNTI